MAVNSVTNQTKFLEWKDITNAIIVAIGDNNSLTTDEKTSLVLAVNEVDAHVDTNITSIQDIITDIGDITNLTTAITTSLVTAINGLQAEATTNAGDISTNAGDIITNAGNITTNSDNIGVIGDLDTTATDIVEAINEVRTESGTHAPYFENFDNGRFSLDTGVTITTYNKGTFFNSNNSSTLTVGDKFINDNSDNGGSAGNMGAEAISLLALLTANGRTEVRYGYEFFISQITAGGGTGDVVNYNSTDYYPITNSGDLFLGSIGEFATWTGYVKNMDAVNDILIGDVNVNVSTYIDGVLQGTLYELSNATGWVHVRQKLNLTQEFRTLFPAILATAGNSTITEIGLSTLYRTDVLNVQLGVVK